MRRASRFAEAILAVLLWVACAANTHAQETVTLRGVVRDSASGRPLLGALVTLGDSVGRTERTDETGAFAIARVQPGPYQLITRRMGFEVDRRAIDVTVSQEPVVVTLRRIAVLDTVRVRATRQGIYGAVGSAHDLAPLPIATVQVLGHGSTRLSVDSSGQFFVPIKTPGAYIVRGNAKGFLSQSVSVTVPPDGGVEVALLLDSARGRSTRVEDYAFVELDERMRLRRSSSVIVPRADLVRINDTQMLSAIRSSRSFVLKGLRIGELACVFVDGRAMPGMSLNRYEPEQVEAVELYTARSEGSGTLSRQWPRAFPCADTGMPRAAPTPSDVKWVVIWLKR